MTHFFRHTFFRHGFPRRLLQALALCLLLGGVAEALQVVIMDRDLQSTLGAGQSVNGRLSLQLASGASGPVVVFIKDDNGQTSSYPGSLRNGQLTLNSGSLAQLLAARGITLVLPGPARNAPPRKGGDDTEAGGFGVGININIDIGAGNGRKK